MKLNKNEIIWFETCGKFPETVLVDTKKMQISTGHELDKFTTMPLRALIFAMNAIVNNRVDEIFENIGDDDE